MAGRIHILIGGHLSTDPRAQKEARALVDAGYEVRVSGVWFDRELAAWDLDLMARTGIVFAPALDFRPGAGWAQMRRIAVRVKARWAREKFRRTGRFSPALLGYGARELLAAAVKARADLTIVHSEAGLWVGRELLRRGHRVGLDFEDWFSRSLSAETRRERPVEILEELERFIARRADYLVAPSQAMADALARSCAMAAPAVVPNVFPWADRAGMDGLRQDRIDPAIPSLHWFSQTIGPHRGLELILGALPLLKNRARLYLRGACSPATRHWLRGLTPPGWRDAVTILPPVPGGELLSRIAEHDIGLALEPAELPNSNLTISNKLFQYLLGGLAVIATNTAGHREALTPCGEAGTLLGEATPEALAQALDFYLDRPDQLARARRGALVAAENLFCWERYRSRVVARAKLALSQG